MIEGKRLLTNHCIIPRYVCGSGNAVNTNTPVTVIVVGMASVLTFPGLTVHKTPVSTFKVAAAMAEELTEPSVSKAWASVGNASRIHVTTSASLKSNAYAAPAFLT
jgi:hypothetical protein